MASFGRWIHGFFGGNAESVTSLIRDALDEPVAPAFAGDSTNFAFRMYEHLGQQSGNLFFSPLSVRIALAMAEAGARGETASQMRETLCISSSEEAARGAFAQTLTRLNATAGANCEVAVANSLWTQDGAPLKSDYIDLIAGNCAGSMNVVNFCDATEAARNAINRWVEEKTRQRIQELIPKGALSPASRLVLVNAVYLKAKWELPFLRSATRAETFYLEDGRTLETPLMRQQTSIRHVQGRGYQAVDLDYRGADLSMLVLLPDRKDGLSHLERTLSVQMLNDCVKQMEYREVRLALPRFKMTWGIDVSDLLKKLGMLLAFSEHADFSGINGRRPPDYEALFISAVLHKAFVEVDEEGTEAAAATSVVLRLGRLPSDPPTNFRADHPFLFAIRDKASGVILFLGRVADPTQ
jgi:serpin B